MVVIERGRNWRTSNEGKRGGGRREEEGEAVDEDILGSQYRRGRDD